MPKRRTNKERTFFSYSEEAMLEAVKAVREQGLSNKKAAEQFGVPRSTLMRKVSGQVPLQRKMGPSTELSEKEENILVTWILAMAKKGFPIHKSNLLLTVKKILESKATEPKYFNNNLTPGRSWFEGFLRRHPNIKEKHAEGVSKARAAVTQDRIYTWYDEIEKYIKENNLEAILIDPSRIFNGDEAGFNLCPKSGKVLGPTKTNEDFYERRGAEKEQITVMAAFSADGKVVPPMLIFPYKKVPKAIAESVPENWGLGRSDSGWMNSEVFYEYIGNHFLPYLKSQGIKRPVLFFVDGHKSHLTQQVSKLCDDNGVILISLFPNTTHIMQPADVSVFKPLKAGWLNAVRNWKFEHFPSEVTRFTFGSILKCVFDNYAKPETIVNGFRRSGLFPFDRENVDYTKCIPNRQINNKEKDSNMPQPLGDEKILEALESRISKTELDLFKATENAQTDWQGNVESTNLYKLWLLVKMSGSKSEQKNDNTNMIESRNIQGKKQIDQESPKKQHKHPTETEMGCNRSPIPSTSTAWETPDHVAHVYEVKQNEGYKVPTPFKKILMFPKTPEKITPKRKRTIFPSVVSSGKYREYYENEKTKRLPKAKDNKAKHVCVEDSSSSESMNEDVKYDDEDIDLSDIEELDLSNGKCVIIKYENTYYPGIILKSDAEGADVKSMKSAGVNSWKWPEKDDILYYFKEDIMCNIKNPILKNQRGHYNIPEMVKYV